MDLHQQRRAPWVQSPPVGIAPEKGATDMKQIVKPAGPIGTVRRPKAGGLALSLRRGERLWIDGPEGGYWITAVETWNGKVRLVIDVPRDVCVLRGELLDESAYRQEG